MLWERGRKVALAGLVWEGSTRTRAHVRSNALAE